MPATHAATVDDEAPVRVALRRLPRLADRGAATYASGDEFLASLAHRAPLALPVVVIAASDGPPVERGALQGGALRVRPNPFGRDKRLATVVFALRAPRPA